jgi:hypothetical protein
VPVSLFPLAKKVPVTGAVIILLLTGKYDSDTAVYLHFFKPALYEIVRVEPAWHPGMRS